MRKEQRDYLVVALPALLVALAVVTLSLPLWLGVLLTALSALVPALVRLRAQAADHIEFTRQVIDVIPHPVYVKDADSRYILVNHAFCEDRGLPHAEIVGLTTQQIARDNNDSGVSRAEDMRVLSGQVIRKEHHDTHPDHGGERHRLVMKGASTTKGGDKVIVGANFDISRWWISEQDLQQELQQERTNHHDSLAFMQRVMDLIPYPVYVKDAAGRYAIANQAMLQESGMSAQQLLGTRGNETGTNEEDAAVLDGKAVLREANEIDAQSGTCRTRIVSKGSCLDSHDERVIIGVHVDLTELRQAERNLQQALEQEVALRERTHAFIQSLIDNIPDPVFIKKSGGRYEMVNEAFAKYRAVDKLTFKGFDLKAPSDNPANRAATFTEDDQVLAGLEIEKEDHTFRQATGEEVFRIISKRRSTFVDGDPVIVGVERHISRWRIAERELNAVLAREMAQRQRTERFVQDLIDVIPDPVYVKNGDGQYLIVNDAFATRRQKPRDEIVGRNSVELTTHNVESAAVSLTEDQQVIAGSEVLKEQHTHLPVTGEEIFRIVCKRRCVSVDGTPVVVGIDHYITEWRLAERELKRLAEEDMLTGIANRRHFNVEARRAIEVAHRHGQALSILMFDLDHFKHINDQYGHNVGDEVLREMSRLMQECFRKSDLPGRWGGEEFIALLPHTSVLAAQPVAERLRASLADQAVSTSCGDIQVTLSGGGAQLQKGDTLESLVARADAALYRAKHGGRNRIEINPHTSPAPGIESEPAKTIHGKAPMPSI